MSLSEGFSQITLQGLDAEKFLVGQVTVDVTKLDAEHYQATAICDLKGRVHFGIWLKRYSAESIEVVIHNDQLADLQAHIKKYGAFSKFTLDAAQPVYLAIEHGKTTFSHTNQNVSVEEWQHAAVTQGEAWISAATSGLFQPQELRLHQRGGVNYDKGCYLGQEIIARLWFRATPKQWLHLITGTGDTPVAGQKLDGDIDVVNAVAFANSDVNSDANNWQALVIARPASLQESSYTILNLPEGLNGSVAREK